MLAAIIWLLCSCNRYCDPVNIKSGRSNQHHDSKPFRASIRVMWTKQYGPFCKVRYENMKLITSRVYDNCNCDKFPTGQWVSLDSI